MSPRGSLDNANALSQQEILLKLRERMVAFAASRLQRDAAEDLAQEVLILLHEKYPRVDRVEELLPLAMKVLRFKMMAVRRKAQRRGEYTQVPVDELPIADGGLDPEADAERRETRERLIAALAQRVAGTHGRRRGGPMNREDARKLLGGYATGNLSAEEQRLLFEAAFDDQELFDALAEEQALKDVLDDPVSRERVRLAVAAAPRPRGWWTRPWIWVPAVGALAASVVLTVALVNWKPGETHEATKTTTVADNRPALKDAAPASQVAPGDAKARSAKAPVPKVTAGKPAGSPPASASAPPRAKDAEPPKQAEAPAAQSSANTVANTAGNTANTSSG